MSNITEVVHIESEIVYEKFKITISLDNNPQQKVKVKVDLNKMLEGIGAAITVTERNMNECPFDDDFEFTCLAQSAFDEVVGGGIYKLDVCRNKYIVFNDGQENIKEAIENFELDPIEAQDVNDIKLEMFWYRILNQMDSYTRGIVQTKLGSDSNKRLFLEWYLKLAPEDLVIEED
jgi:hypothetical protein